MADVIIPKISFQSVSKSYDKDVAVSELTFDVARNSFVALLGPSGCGKSTLLNMVAGFVAPTTGQVLVDGLRVTEPSSDRGVVFQEYALFPWLTAAQNVAFGPRMAHENATRQRQIAEQYLKLVGLEAHAEKFPSQLSGGMRQRVSIARALANKPSILLMDEPFGALDAQTRETLQEELVNIWQSLKSTLLFVTHSVSEAVYLADKIVVMGTRPGRIREIIPYAAPYPRDRLSAGFRDLEGRIHTMIREETRKLGVM